MNLIGVTYSSELIASPVYEFPEVLKQSRGALTPPDNDA
jgi:hypothetical protein